MKNILLILGLFLTLTSTSQTKMTINCDVTKDNKQLKEDDFFIISITDNKGNRIFRKANTKFIYQLDYNKEYIITFEYEKCQSKSICFNNYTNNYPDLTCFFNINLKTSNSEDILEVAEVYYDNKQNEFNYKLLNLN